MNLNPSISRVKFDVHRLPLVGLFSGGVSAKMKLGMATFRYEFEWDPHKAKANFNKHGVHFERAAQIFRDPLALTIPDEQHSENEVRWITLGRDANMCWWFTRSCS